jgi:hypothetical protein
MTATNEDDVRLLLHSPALALEPSSGLADSVRVRARGVRHRRRAASLALSVVVVAGAIVVGPSLAAGIEDLVTSSPNQSAGRQPDPRFPAATSEVLTLRTINGAQVVTWWEKSQWCTAVSRITSGRFCVGPVNPQGQAIPRYLNAGGPSLTVDRRSLVAGVARRDVKEVTVHLVDGRVLEGKLEDGDGFLLPVWSALIGDPAAHVAYILAYGEQGQELAKISL